MGYAVLLKIRISFNSDSARYLTRRERKKNLRDLHGGNARTTAVWKPRDPMTESWFWAALPFFPPLFWGVKKTIEAWAFRNRSLLKYLCNKVIWGENWFLILIVNNSTWLLICSLPRSSVHGILQARILEWVAIPFSRGSSQPMIRTQVSCIEVDSLPPEPLGRPTDLLVLQLNVESRELSLLTEKCTLTHPSNETL